MISAVSRAECLADVMNVISEKGIIVIKNKSKLLCYTDGLIETIDDKNIIYATDSVEAHITNSDSIEKNIANIIEDQKINADNAGIFDDVTMLGVEFYLPS